MYTEFVVIYVKVVEKIKYKYKVEKSSFAADKVIF